MIRQLTMALLILLAGCSAISGNGPPDPNAGTGTPVDTTRPTPVQSTPTDAAGNSTVPDDATADNTIEYAELSATQQRAFDQARAGEARFLYRSTIESPYVEGEYFAREVADPFENHEYVRKNGSFYRLSYDGTGGRSVASYGIEATERRPPENATVVAFGNLSSRVRDPVRWAIENGSYGVPAGQWDSLPEELSGVEYVRSAGTHYRITIRYGDEWAGVLRVEKVGQVDES